MNALEMHNVALGVNNSHEEEYYNSIIEMIERAATSGKFSEDVGSFMIVGNTYTKLTVLGFKLSKVHRVPAMPTYDDVITISW